MGPICLWLFQCSTRIQVAAAAAGFMLGNDLLIVTGALVGSSGAILSIIMCKAMNRSFWSVIFGGFGDAKVGASSNEIEGEVTSIQHEEVAELLKESKSIVIVPGYGMAVAKAQYPIQELTSLLKKQGKPVHFAIHPVAEDCLGIERFVGRSQCSLCIVFEMDEINDELSETDLVPS